MASRRCWVENCASFPWHFTHGHHWVPICQQQWQTVSLQYGLLSQGWPQLTTLWKKQTVFVFILPGKHTCSAIQICLSYLLLPILALIDMENVLSTIMVFNTKLLWSQNSFCSKRSTSVDHCSWSYLWRDSIFCCCCCTQYSCFVLAELWFLNVFFICRLLKIWGNAYDHWVDDSGG